MCRKSWLLLPFLIALCCGSVFAQLPALSTAASPASTSTANDPFGRSTPRGTVKSFIEAAHHGDYGKAVTYLDTKQRGAPAIELAKQLAFVLDHETSIGLSNLSDRPEGNLTDNLQANRDLVGEVTIGSGAVPIYVDRVQRNGSPPIWLFSSDTLRSAPEMYDEISGSDLAAHLPNWATETRFLGQPLWHWLAIVIAIPLVFLLSALLQQLLRTILKMISLHFSGRDVRLETFTSVLRVLIIGIFTRIGSAYLESLLARQFWGVAGDVVIVIAISWLVAKAIRIASDLGVSRLQRTQAAERIAMAQLLARIAQVLVITFGGLGILYLIGVNLTAALTGLGIGGLAVAFAAQKTLENLFGGIMLVSDRPIRIGDACKVGDYSGTVVDIGFRSTRIRTPDRTIVSIPNGQLATMNIENYTLRDKYWLHPTISLKYDTTPEQLEITLGELRRLFEGHPKVEPGTFRVSFFRLGTSSLDIELFAYFLVTDYNEFMSLQELVLLRILAIVEEAGTALALPSQTMYVAQAHSDSKTQAAQEASPQQAKIPISSTSRSLKIS